MRVVYVLIVLTAFCHFCGTVQKLQTLYARSTQVFSLREMKAGEMGSVSQSEHSIRYIVPKGAVSNMITCRAIHLNISFKLQS